jgi:hypothetical protein
MSNLRAQKFDAAGWLAKLMEYPLDVRGAFATIQAKLMLSDTPGAETKRLSQWAIILGVSEGKAVELIRLLAEERLISEDGLPPSGGHSLRNEISNTRITISFPGQKQEETRSAGTIRKANYDARERTRDALGKMGVYEAVCAEMRRRGLADNRWTTEDCATALDVGRALCSPPGNIPGTPTGDVQGDLS